MNRKKYNSDPRYAKVLEQMDLLGIMDISTTRQDKNGTIVWKLPIKDQDTGILIEVASFASGYVRNQGKSTRSNFQLNKRIPKDEFYPEYKHIELSDGSYTSKITKPLGMIIILIILKSGLVNIENILENNVYLYQ